MYRNSICTISYLQTGFEVEIEDPAIKEKNAKRDRGSDNTCCVPYEETRKCFAFSNIDEVCDFLKTALPKAVPKKDSSTFDDAFASAIEPDDDNNDEDDD